MKITTIKHKFLALFVCLFVLGFSGLQAQTTTVTQAAITAALSGSGVINVTGDAVINDNIIVQNSGTAKTLTIIVTGNITINGSLDLSGTNGAGGNCNSAEAGKDGHSIVLNAGGTLTVNANISTAGGKAGDVTECHNANSIGKKGGNAGSVTLMATNDISISSGIDAVGGNAGTITGTANIVGGSGGNGGTIIIKSDAGTIDVTGDINVSGANASDANNCQQNGINAQPPGEAGVALITAKKDVVINDKITANGGSSGITNINSTTNSAGKAKIGGKITIVSASEYVTIKKDITANGGAGAMQGNDVCGTAGADGGEIVVEAAKDLNIQGTVTANGGRSGDARHNTTYSGNTNPCETGGNGGSVDLSAENINVDAPVQVNGAEGGMSGSQGGGDASAGKAGIGGNGGNVNLGGNVNNSSTITANGGNGGSRWTQVPPSSFGGSDGGRCSSGGLGGNINTNGTPAAGTNGVNGACGSGNLYTPATPCTTPTISGLLAVIPPFCLDNNTNLTVSLTAPTIEWNGTTEQSKGFEIETSAGSGTYAILTLPYTVADNAENGRKVRYFATNTCGKSGYAYAVITKSCIDNDLQAIISGDTTICKDGKATLTIEITGTAPAPYTVMLSDGTEKSGNSPIAIEIEPDVTTTYTIASVTASDNTVGSTSGSVKITVQEKVNITLSPAEMHIAPGEKITITPDPQRNDIIWYWNGAEFTPVFPQAAYQDAEITAKVNDGVCEGDLSAPAIIKVSWANAFTPEGSDNQIFAKDINSKMMVFNRFGQKVYEGTDGWDGKYKKKFVEPGTYYYVIEFDNGEVRKATIEVVKEK